MSEAENVRAAAMASLREVATTFFAEHPEYRSMMLGVAQFWADEADDAVHYELVASVRATPLWPHICDSWGGVNNVPGECCASCETFEGLDWHENSSSIQAFEAYCHEVGSQEESNAYNFLPYAIARKTGDAVEIEIVGRLQRPENEMMDPDPGTPDETWNDARARALLDLVAQSPADDGPRRVLADYLMERDNPRGEYIALALDDKPEAAALLDEYGREWMYPLRLVVPSSSATWSRGFLRACEVYADEDAANEVRGALAWSTVENLFVHSTSACVLDPVMRSLRELGPIDSSWFDALLAAEQPWAIETLHVELEDVADVQRLATATNLPALRHLLVISDHADAVVAALPHAPWWPQLERLTIVTSEPNVTHWQWRRVELSVPWLAVAARHTVPVNATGWEFAFYRSGGCEVTLRGYTQFGTRPDLAHHIAGLHGDTIKLVPSAYYEPAEDDVEYLLPEAMGHITL